MLFNSTTFIIFFALVLALHSLPLGWGARKFNLLLASYVFYAAWNPLYITLIAASTLVDWFLARAIFNAREQRRRRWLLIGSLGFNLGLLGLFKYADFFLASSTSLLGWFGIGYTPPVLDLVLPVGISFYTFQTLSYTLDVYYRRLAPWDRFSDYALYVAFFPQLVAGPIVRARYFLPQLKEPKRASADNLAWGLCLIVLGLFQKTVLADDILAPVADAAYAAGSLTTTGAWFGTTAFAGQILFDFAGYSSCAIGIAMCLGFQIPINFRFPYAAIGFRDFWRRWHISLSQWLRDYLYIPLGGNRGSRFRNARNLMLTMLLGGLWHGAAWTFVLWGGLHGLYLIAERFAVAGLGGMKLWQTWPARTALGLMTFAAVCLAWAFFRSESLHQGLMVSHAMLGFGPSDGFSFGASLMNWIALGLIAAMLLVHGLMRNRELRELAETTPWWLRGAVIAIMLFLILTSPGNSQAFIYFQF